MVYRLGPQVMGWELKRGGADGRMKEGIVSQDL